MGGGDTSLNAAVGAAVGLLLSFLPAAIVLGGAVAGYLLGASRDYGVGARVGDRFSVVGLPFALLGAGYVVGRGALGGVVGGYLLDEF